MNLARNQRKLDKAREHAHPAHTYITCPQCFDTPIRTSPLHCIHTPPEGLLILFLLITARAAIILRPSDYAQHLLTTPASPHGTPFNALSSRVWHSRSCIAPQNQSLACKQPLGAGLAPFAPLGRLHSPKGSTRGTPPIEPFVIRPVGSAAE